MNGQIPTMRFELEGVRQTLLVALSQYSSQLNAVVEETIAKMDLDAMIRYEVQTIAPQIFRNALKESIELACQQSGIRIMDAIRDNPDFQVKITEALLATLELDLAVKRSYTSNVEDRYKKKEDQTS